MKFTIIKQVINFFLFSVIFATPQFIISTQQNQGKEFLVLTNPGYDPGLFSIFTTLLGLLDCYDKNPQKYSGLKVNFDSGAYVEKKFGNNWWEYFFEPILKGNPNCLSKRFFSDGEKSFLAMYTLRNISRERGNQLIRKYIQVKPHIQKEIDDFISLNFSNDFVIGVHYRGTDKVVLEVKRVDYEKIEEAVLNIMQKYLKGSNRKFKIFIATDEAQFLAYMKERFSSIPIIYIDCLRSSNYTPLHTKGHYSSNYEKGKHAVLDCLLLSKCDVIIRTSSNLSFCAERFNPQIPVIFLK